MHAPSCILFLVIAFTLAGLAQVAWLKSPHSRRVAQPIDGGWTLSDGRRLFGANKTFRGFVIMVPATALTFWVFGGGRELFGATYANGLWDLSATAYAALGAWTGFAFMLAELPNSFIKRRLGVAPGSAPAAPAWRPVCFLVDQVDSVLGGILALALIVPVPTPVWISILLSGLLVHWLFNLLLKQIGLKTRAA